MQFRDLKAQYLTMKEEMDTAISDVLENSNFISGRQVLELETKLAEYIGVKHCITCANGTDALTLALMAWEIGEGDAVFVPDFTFFASGEVVSFAGATPVFVDVERETYNISPASLEKAIARVLKEDRLKPRVIIAVDLFGQPADFLKIRQIADKYGLLVLEDGAQGFGGRIRNKKACSFGDISTTSFFPAKPLGCYGDGGAVFTDNDEWAEVIRSLRIHGKGKNKYDNIRIGMNSRLDTLQAAILLIKFQKFKMYELENVNKVAKSYTAYLKEYVEVPVIKEDFYSSWAQYTIRLKDESQRNLLQEHLKRNDIPSMIYYQKPMHNQQAFIETSPMKNDFPIASHLCKTVLALPIHPYMTEEDIIDVSSEIKKSVG